MKIFKQEWKQETTMQAIIWRSHQHFATIVLKHCYKLSFLSILKWILYNSGHFKFILSFEIKIYHPHTHTHTFPRWLF